MPKKSKRPAVDVPVPSNAEECSLFIRQLGGLNRQLAVRKAEMDEKIAAIQLEYAPVLLDLAQRATSLEQGIQTWSEAHRQELTNCGKTKTARLVTGEIAWRARPPSVSVRNEKDVITQLRALQLSDYIRTTEAIDKEAILRLDADVMTMTDEQLVAGGESAEAKVKLRQHRELLRTIKGLSIARGVEDFVITPFETDDATGLGGAQPA